MKTEILKYIVVFLALCFSCKGEKKQNTIVQEKENPKNIRLFYEDIAGDSIEIRIEYTSLLDSIKPSEKNERFTFLFLTREDITTAEMEEIIEKDDKKRMKEENLKGYNLGDKRSMVLHYKLNPQEKNYLIVLVKDIAFLDDYNENRDTRMIQNVTTIKEEIHMNTTPIDSN